MIETVMDFSPITEPMMMFIPSAILVLCVVGGIKLGIHFFKNSFH